MTQKDGRTTLNMAGMTLGLPVGRSDLLVDALAAMRPMLRRDVFSTEQAFIACAQLMRQEGHSAGAVDYMVATAASIARVQHELADAGGLDGYGPDAMRRDAVMQDNRAHVLAEVAGYMRRLSDAQGRAGDHGAHP